MIEISVSESPASTDMPQDDQVVGYKPVASYRDEVDRVEGPTGDHRIHWSDHQEDVTDSR